VPEGVGLPLPPDPPCTHLPVTVEESKSSRSEVSLGPAHVPAPRPSTDCAGLRARTAGRSRILPSRSRLGAPAPMGGGEAPPNKQAGARGELFQMGRMEEVLRPGSRRAQSRVEGSRLSLSPKAGRSTQFGQGRRFSPPGSQAEFRFVVRKQQGERCQYLSQRARTGTRPARPVTPGRCHARSRPVGPGDGDGGIRALARTATGGRNRSPEADL
jgi:hypothetical protein